MKKVKKKMNNEYITKTERQKEKEERQRERDYSNLNKNFYRSFISLFQ